MTIDANTTLALAFQGTHGQNTQVDNGPLALSPITAVGNASISTVEYYFPNSSAYFDGTAGNYWEVPDDDAWNFMLHNNPFTIKMWIRFNDLTPHGIASQYLSGTEYWELRWTPNQLQFYAPQPFNHSEYFANWTPLIDTWYHLQFSTTYFSAGDPYWFVDGVHLADSGFINDSWAYGLASPMRIGYAQGAGTYLNGYINDFSVSNIVRNTSGFTPPTVPDNGWFIPPPPQPVEQYAGLFTKNIIVPKRPKPLVNPGDFDVAGLNVPVPIKMDKWQNLSQPPARRKKTNPANVGQYAFVDFSIPTLPEVLINQWLNINAPRKSKPPRVLPAAFASSEIAAINPVNGNYFDSGVIRFDITIENTESQTYKDSGVVGLTITAEHIEDFQLEDTGVFGFLIKYPDTGVEVFNSGVPGFVASNVIIDGVNQSNLLQGTISVSREDNAAARFSLSLEHDPTLPIPKKPVEFINKIITINFAAAGMDGVVSDYVPIFIGIIKGVSFNPDKDTMKITGYDYSGIHQTRGEYISGNITDVLTGSVGAGSAGTINTAHSPIWGVVWNGNNAVKDGTDYFVDTKNGQIVIPISSRILQFPGSFTYNYANNFVTMKDIIQAIISEKSWTIKEDGVTIADYTSEAAHPVLSLSDESVIDTCRKFLELSGAKVEGNLFPELRVYSEVENWTNPVNTITFDETIIFENGLNYSIDFDNILNEQTVRSVQRVSAEIEIGALETIATFEADSPSTNPFTVQQGITWVWKLDLATPTVLAEHRIAKSGLNSISLSASGRFHLALWPNQFVESISGGSFNWFVDGDDFVIQLSHNVVVVRVLNLGLYAYPAFEYSLTVNGSRINYGGGSPEDVRVVTAQRPIGGITETLKGDVYENPYIETDTHCVNICNAVLLEHGNPYTAQFDIPLYQGKTAQIGMRVDIKRDGNIKFSGIIKKLDYNMNLENGENRITVIATGIGKGI